jgi:hypothetical protein
MSSWSFVGASTVGSSASGDLTAPIPTGVANGDLITVAIAYRGTATFSATSDWTVIEQDANGNTVTGGTTSGTDNGQLSGIFFAFAIYSATLSFTFTRAVTGSDVGKPAVAAYRWGGAAGTITLDSHSQNQLTTASTACSTGALTAARADTLVVAACSSSANSNAGTGRNFRATDPATGSGTTIDPTTAPTAGSWFLRENNSTATGADVAVAIGEGIKATSGSTGSVLATSTFVRKHTMVAAAFSVSTSVNGSGAGGVGTVSGTAPGGVGAGAGAASGGAGTVTASAPGGVAGGGGSAAGAMGTVTATAPGPESLSLAFHSESSKAQATATGTLTLDSFTATAGWNLYALAVYIADATAPDLSIGDTQNLAWSPIYDREITVGSSYFRLLGWRAVSNGNATSVSFTRVGSDAGSCAAAVIALSGADSTVARVATAGDTAGDPAPDFGVVPAAASPVLTFFAAASNGPATVPTGYTDMNGVGAIGSTRAVAIQLARKPSSAGQTAAWTSSLTAAVAVALELRIATASGTANGSAGPGTITASAPGGVGSGASAASGGIETIAATAPGGTAAGAGSGTGAIATASTAAPGGTGTGGGGGAGDAGTVAATAPAGAGTGAGHGVAPIPTVDLIVPVGNASGGSGTQSGSGTGSIGSASTGAPGGAAVGSGNGAAGIAVAAMAAPQGAGSGSAALAGALGSIAVEAAAGTATADGAGQGDLADVALAAAEGSGRGDAAGSGGSNVVQLFPPDGEATAPMRTPPDRTGSPASRDRIIGAAGTGRVAYPRRAA